MIQANRNVVSFNTIIEILQNDQSKIKLIRKYENTRKKLINNECAILFNKTCINVRLLPKYSDIGHDRATNAQTAQFRMDTVADQLSKANGRKLELAAELKAIENEILSLIGAETFDGCQTIINQLLGNLRRKEETKTLNKLNRLYKGTLKLPESLDQYVNLSKHSLTEPEKELLNLGLNCHVSSKFDRYIKATEMEILYDSILKLETDRKITVSAGFRDQLRGEATKVRGDGRSTLLMGDPRLWEAAKSLRNNE